MDQNSPELAILPEWASDIPEEEELPAFIAILLHVPNKFVWSGSLKENKQTNVEICSSWVLFCTYDYIVVFCKANRESYIECLSILRTKKVGMVYQNL